MEKSWEKHVESMCLFPLGKQHNVRLGCFKLSIESIKTYHESTSCQSLIGTHVRRTPGCVCVCVWICVTLWLRGCSLKFLERTVFCWRELDCVLQPGWSSVTWNCSISGSVSIKLPHSAAVSVVFGVSIQDTVTSGRKQTCLAEGVSIGTLDSILLEILVSTLPYTCKTDFKRYLDVHTVKQSTC